VLSRLSILLAEDREEVFREEWNIFLPFTKWRNEDLNDAQSVVEVFT